MKSIKVVCMCVCADSAIFNKMNSKETFFSFVFHFLASLNGK